MVEKTHDRLLCMMTGLLIALAPILHGGAGPVPQGVVSGLILSALFSSTLYRIIAGYPAAGPRRDLTFERYGAGLAVIVVVSGVFSIYRYASFQAAMLLGSYVALYYLILYGFSRSLRRFLVNALIIVAAILSAYGLLQYFGLFSHPWWDPADHLASTYVNHNHFAGFLEMAIPVTVGTLIRYRNRRPWIVLLTAESLILMIVAFVFSQSRGGWLSLTAALLFMGGVLFLHGGVARKAAVIFGGVIFMLFAALYVQSGAIADRMAAFNDIRAGEPSTEIRKMIWEGAYDMIADNWLIGTGIGTFEWGFSRYRPEGLNVRPRFAHNDYLQMAAEAGSGALLFMLLMVIRVILAGLKAGRRNPVILGCAIGLMSVSLHGFVDFNFHIPANMVLLVVFAALIMSTDDENERCIGNG